MFEASTTTVVLSNRGGKLQTSVCIGLVECAGTTSSDYSDSEKTSLLQPS